MRQRNGKRTNGKTNKGQAAAIPIAAAIRRNYEKADKKDFGGNGLNNRRVGYKLSHLHGRTSRCVGISL